MTHSLLHCYCRRGANNLVASSLALSITRTTHRHKTVSSEIINVSQIVRRQMSATSSNDNDRLNDDPFTELEYKNWQQGVDVYSRGFGPLTAQAVPKLLEATRFPPPPVPSSTSDIDNNTTMYHHFLDVACGPGQVVSEAISSLSKSTSSPKPFKFTAFDFSSNFLRLAKKNVQDRHPDIMTDGDTKIGSNTVEFVEGDAQSMPFGDNTFDSVACNFGILHLSSPLLFLKEAYRILKPGGWLSYSVWAKPPATEGFELILNAVQDRGNPSVELPEGPPFFQFADPTESSQCLKGVGFTNIEIIEYGSDESMIWSNVNTSQQLYTIFLEGTARTRELLKKQTHDQSVEIQKQLDDEWKIKTQNGKVALKMPIVISCGMKPL